MKSKYIIYTTLVGILLGFAFISKPFILMIFSSVLIFAIAALGLNILSGYTGQVSIGHGAFMAIGAYTTATMAIQLHTPFVLNLIFAVIFSAVLGIIIGLPALRLKGFYLAIATMAFGVAVEQLITAMEFFGGHTGIRNIPKLSENDFVVYIINLLFYVILSFISYKVIDSPIGIKYKMIRDSEVAAKAYGINLSRVKLNAFVISAVYGGIAGALYAETIGYISPSDFGLNISLNLLAMIVIGGMASIQGGFVGAILITGLPFLFSRGQIPMTLIFGTLLIIFVLFFPKGIAYGITLFYYKHMQKPYVWLIKKVLGGKKMDGKYINVKDKKIYYIEKGDGIPVICLHGNFASSTWYKKVINIPGYRMIAPDIVNFGRSDSIEKADIDIYAEYITQFIKELKLENIILVGHSLGGAVAQAISYKNPEQVKKLILIDSAPVDGLKTPEEYYPILEMYKGNKDLLKKALAGTMPASQDEKFLEEVTNDGLLMNPICFTENARALERYNYTEISNNFKNPVLFIVGKKDLLVTREMAERTVKNLNGRIEIIDHVGHSIIAEDPELFINLFKEFTTK